MANGPNGVDYHRMKFIGYGPTDAIPNFEGGNRKIWCQVKCSKCDLRKWITSDTDGGHPSMHPEAITQLEVYLGKTCRLVSTITKSE